MRSWLAAFTTRGTSFLAAGAAAALAGLFLNERDLVSVGILLLVLPLFSALAAGRARYRLSCVRSISPPRVAAGQTAMVRVHLENVSRLPTGLLLAEDAVPYALGTRPRYVLNGIERGGSRELSYPLRSDLRGKFVVGPLEIRIADAFGLVELGRSFSSSTTFVVTNNHFEAKGIVNALQLIHLLSGNKVKVPEALRAHYPQLEAIANEPAAAPTLFPLPPK